MCAIRGAQWGGWGVWHVCFIGLRGCRAPTPTHWRRWRSCRTGSGGCSGTERDWGAEVHRRPVRLPLRIPFFFNWSKVYRVRRWCRGGCNSSRLSSPRRFCLWSDVPSNDMQFPVCTTKMIFSLIHSTERFPFFPCFRFSSFQFLKHTQKYYCRPRLIIMC